MKTIIAGTDFTPSSVNACRYAALLAQKLNCKLTVFNLFDAPIVHSNLGMYGVSYNFEKSSTQRRTKKLIHELEEQFPGLKINAFVTTGSFKEELKAFTGAHHVEAVVMGLAAKSRISKFIYGSHGVNLAGKIDAPVIIVPEKYKEHKIADVLLAVDNQEKLSMSSLSGFQKFVKRSKAPLRLLHVRTADEIFPPVFKEVKVNKRIHAIETVNAKTVENGIRNYTRDRRVDLIAIISKQHSPFYNFFSESNTKKIAFAASVPVMAIHG